MVCVASSSSGRGQMNLRAVIMNSLGSVLLFCVKTSGCGDEGPEVQALLGEELGPRINSTT